MRTHPLRCLQGPGDQTLFAHLRPLPLASCRHLPCCTKRAHSCPLPRRCIKPVGLTFERASSSQRDPRFLRPRPESDSVGSGVRLKSAFLRSSQATSCRQSRGHTLRSWCKPSPSSVTSLGKPSWTFQRHSVPSYMPLWDLRTSHST